MVAVALCHDGAHGIGALAHEAPDEARDGDGVGVGVHCVAPFVAGPSGDKDSMPKWFGPVKYLLREYVPARRSVQFLHVSTPVL